MEFHHIPVLLNETIAALKIGANGTYVDLTAGGGGHSAAILEKLGKEGHLIAVDRDPQAIERISQRFNSNTNITIIHDNFFNIKNILGNKKADGILADLGVSSFQLDNDERGFSYHSGAPLDMRMSMEGMSAADAVNSLPEQELSRILFKWGEEKYASSIARKIVKRRAEEPIETTLQLAELVKSAVPASRRRESGHPARKTFQALRIYVNGELENLNAALSDMFDSLNPGGRLAIISFHSIEDRIIKKFFAEKCIGCVCPNSFPVCVCGKTPAAKIPFKSVVPSQEEIDINRRSRSARLRVLEKIKDD